MKILFSLLIILFLSSEVYAFSNKDINNANRLFKEGKYTDAIEIYKKTLKDTPESDVINFNLGTAYYKNNQIEEAKQSLLKSLLTEDKSLRQKAHFNLGQVLYKDGLGKEDGNLKEAIQSMENSLSHFESALSLDSNDKDSAYYVDLLKKEIDRLKQKPPQEQDQNQNQKQSESNEDQSQQDSKENKDQDQSQNQQDQNNQRDQKNQQDQANQDQSQESDSQQGNQKDDQDSSSAKQNQSQEDRNQNQSSENDQNQTNQNQDQENQQLNDQSQNSSQIPNETQTQNAYNGNSSQAQEAITKKEAKVLLESYSQSEEPKGLLKTYQGQRRPQGTFKDW